MVYSPLVMEFVLFLAEKKDNHESTKTRNLCWGSFFGAFVSLRAFVIILLFGFWLVQVRI